MLKVLAIIALVAIVVFGGILALATMQPDEFRVARSKAINAPPEKIFPYLNDLRQFALWSPFEKKDPDMLRTFSGPASGVGAVYEFAGDGNVGKGKLAITDSTPPGKIEMQLTMVEPIAADNRITFTLVPNGASTDVTWVMLGATPFVGKIMHVICNFDKMIGGDFEAGLDSLKALAEK